MRSTVRNGILWSFLLLGLAAVIAGVVSFVLLPGYNSPDSRLWSLPIGYPALLRWRGRPIPVEIVTAKRHTLRRVVAAEGSLRFLNVIPVNIEVPGIVAELDIAPGDQVSRGDVLMRIDTGGYETRLAKLEVDLRMTAFKRAEETYAREKSAYEMGLPIATVTTGGKSSLMVMI